MFEKKSKAKSEVIQIRVSTVQKEVIKKMCNDLELTQSELILNLLELQLRYKVLEKYNK